VHHVGLIALDAEVFRVTEFDDLAGEQETLAWSPDGRTLAVGSICTGRHVRIYLWDQITREVTPVTEDDYGASNPAFSPDGKWLAFSATRDGATDIFIYELATGAMINLTPGESKERHPAWSPDSQWIAYTSDASGNDDIWVMRVDGTEPRNVTNAPGRDILPSWGGGPARVDG